MATEQLSPDFHTWQSKYPTSESQMEFFLLKTQADGDVSRTKLEILKQQFDKYDSKGNNLLEEHDALRLLESRNETKTFVELRKMLEEIDQNKDHRVSFLEFVAAVLKKPWKKLFTLAVDPEELAKAEAIEKAAEAELMRKSAEKEAALRAEEERKLEQMKADMDKLMAEQGVEAAHRAKEALEAEIHRQETERKRRAEEQAAEEQRRKDEAEARRKEELGRGGVAGKAALFKYAALDSRDSTQDNATRIKAEAAARKAEKEAKLKAEAEKKKAEEDAARAAADAEVARKKAEEAAVEAARAAEDKTRAEAEAADAEQKRLEAEEEKRKALEGTEAARRQREIYEEEKRKAEEEAARKAEEEHQKRMESRRRLADRAALWSQSAPQDVMKDLTKSPSLKKASTAQADPLAQVKVFANIQKGVQLKHTDAAANDDLSDALKQAYIEDQKERSESN